MSKNKKKWNQEEPKDFAEGDLETFGELEPVPSEEVAPEEPVSEEVVEEEAAPEEVKEEAKPNPFEFQNGSKLKVTSVRALTYSEPNVRSEIQPAVSRGNQVTVVDANPKDGWLEVEIPAVGGNRKAFIETNRVMVIG